MTGLLPSNVNPDRVRWVNQEYELLARKCPWRNNGLANSADTTRHATGKKTQDSVKSAELNGQPSAHIPSLIVTGAESINGKPAGEGTGSAVSRATMIEKAIVTVVTLMDTTGRPDGYYYNNHAFESFSWDTDRCQRQPTATVEVIILKDPNGQPATTVTKGLAGILGVGSDVPTAFRSWSFRSGNSRRLRMQL